MILIYFICSFLYAQNNQKTQDTQPFQWSESQNSLAFKEQEHLAFHQGKWQTNGLLLIKDNKVLFERYANGFDQNKLHRIWSASKSISALLIGKRLEELALEVNHPIAHEIKDLQSAFKDQLTLRHLLQMSSGLKWNEFYEGNPFQSDVVAMLYLEENMGAFSAQKKSRARPGQYFNYSSGETNLLMRWLKKTFTEQPLYDDYPKKALFSPLGIENYSWEQDYSGTFVGSSYLYMTARDLAKVGKLILEKGKWNEQQIIPSSFLKDAVTNSPSLCQTPLPKAMRNATYGYHFWLNQKCPQRDSFFKDVEPNIIMALGHHGQTMILWPSLNAIAIRFGADKKERFPRGKWAKLVQKDLREVSNE